MAASTDSNTFHRSEQIDATLNAARQVLYRYLSLALVDPLVGSWPQLSDPQTQQSVLAAAELLRGVPVVASSERGPAELPADKLDAAELLKHLPATEQLLTESYERVFGLLITGTNPPHEMEYVNEKLTFQRTHHLADIAGFYQAFGLQTRLEYPDRQDHIVMELEFMAFLIGMERQATGEAGPESAEHAEVCRHAQGRFLSEHLAWWTPAFGRILAHEHPQSYYAAVGTLLAAFIPAERVLFGLEPFAGTVKPEKTDPSSNCDDCALHST